MLREKEVFKYAKANSLSLTFDDVLLVPGHSEIHPNNVSLKTYFARGVSLNIPIVSAAMDTITDHRLAIALANEGGLGIIHMGGTPQEQAQEVNRVKYFLQGRIDKPIVVYETESVDSVLRRREEKDWRFNSFPVVNAQNRLVGIVTSRDFKFCDNPECSIGEIISRELLIALGDTSFEDAYTLLHSNKKSILPLVEDGLIVGMYVYSDLERVKNDNSHNHNLDSKGRLKVGASIGTGKEGLLRLEVLVRKEPDVIVLDTAHADSDRVFGTLREIKQTYSSLPIVAGNVSSSEAVRGLQDCGADGVKAGQGGGGICTTRIISGAGIPQLSAVNECAMASDVPLCSDGGARYTGDITKAIGAGAQSVMVGTLLAGTEETPGDVILRDGKQYKRFRGMGSLSAMRESREARERYMQEENPEDKLVPEGI